MNMQRPLYARLTINGKRFDLGYATMSQILLRAAQTFSSHRSTSNDVVVTLEASGAKLPDSSVLNREAILEQSVAAQIVTDQDEESPFEGITIGRVAEVMASPEYALYNHYCQPMNRQGAGFDSIERAKFAYHEAYPDCSPHFPKWVES